MTEQIILSADPIELQVEPGQRIESTISIQNVSNRLKAVSIEITDLDRSWYELSSHTVSIFPDDSVEVTLSVSVPGVNEAVAKIYPFTVKANYQDSSEPQVTQPLSLKVLPVYSFETELSPKRVIGSTGSYALAIANKGNAELSFSLDATDERNGCTYLFSPERPRVPPGEEASVEVAVSPNQRKLRGPNELYNFDLKVSPDVDNLSPVQVFGLLEVPSKLQGWVVPLGGLLAIVLVAAIGYGIFLGVNNLLSRDPKPVPPEDNNFNVVEDYPTLAPGQAKGVILDDNGLPEPVPGDKDAVITVNARWVLSTQDVDVDLQVILVRPNGDCRVQDQSEPEGFKSVFEIPGVGRKNWIEGCPVLKGTLDLDPTYVQDTYAVYLKTHDEHEVVTGVNDVKLRVKWEIPRK